MNPDLAERGCTCRSGRDHDGSEFGACEYCEERAWQIAHGLDEGDEIMSDYYSDRGAHRRFRYEARGSDGCQGYTLGTYRTKAEALEAVLKDKRDQETYQRTF